MRKKRKSREVKDPEKVEEENQPERPKRTLLGWKDNPQQNDDDGEAASSSSFFLFRNKEKVLVTCSRRINFRYRHLMLNVVALFPHCKKDNKVESKETKGATINGA